MFFTGCFFEILLILRYIKKIHNGDLDDGYNNVYLKKNGNIYTLLTTVKQYVYIWRYNRIL